MRPIASSAPSAFRQVFVRELPGDGVDLDMADALILSYVVKDSQETPPTLPANSASAGPRAPYTCLYRGRGIQDEGPRRRTGPRWCGPTSPGIRASARAPGAM